MGRGSSKAKIRPSHAVSRRSRPNKVSARELKQQLAGALQQQSATAEQYKAASEVLRIMARTPTDTQAVFDMIANSAARVCNAQFSFVYRFDGTLLHLMAHHGLTPEAVDIVRASFPMEPGRQSAGARAVLSGEIEQIPDVHADPDYVQGIAAVINSRSIVAVPMVRGGVSVGAIALDRTEVGLFPAWQLKLLRTFADQAVIAIENLRMFDEVQARTKELAHSITELHALGEVSQAVNSTIDLETVLSTIVAKAVQLSGTDGGAIYVFSAVRQKFRLRATYGMAKELIEAIGKQPMGTGESYIGRATQSGETLQVTDLREEPPTAMRDLVLHAGYRALLVVPLLRSDRIVGALVVRRREPGLFPASSIDLLQTFAAQSVLAIQNARLFSDIEEKSRQLELASRHKSEFLANMSHELRTPLNAVLGFTEMIVDGLYGPLPEKALNALERVRTNGKHLLGLINDVLDLSKIEAGQLTLSLQAYALAQLVQNVLAGTESLAKAKRLVLRADVQNELPAGHGDERRLTQVLLNLVGNAIKFTERGSVEISASASGGCFIIAVRDTGPGIAPGDRARIFEEFQQVLDNRTREKGGTGLGLAISKRIVEMHGGTIEVQSELGSGSTFRILLPVQANGA